MDRLAPRRVVSGVRRRTTRKPPLHFIHVSKTGGSAIKAALRPHEFSGPGHIRLHGHEVRLDDLSPGEPFFFALRDPLTRFVSGYYSRKFEGGHGRPRPLTAAEAPVYERFRTPNELAEALSARDHDARDAALYAMRTIRHFVSMWFWLGSPELLARRADDVLMAMSQERLTQDFELLAARLGITAVLPSSDAAAHRTPRDVDRTLSDVATTNLRRWFRADLELLEVARSISDPAR